MEDHERVFGNSTPIELRAHRLRRDLLLVDDPLATLDELDVLDAAGYHVALGRMLASAPAGEPRSSLPSDSAAIAVMARPTETPRSLPSPDVLPRRLLDGIVRPSAGIIRELRDLSRSADVHGRIRRQLDRLETAGVDVELAIGTAKELLESVVATLFEFISGTEQEQHDLPRRLRELQRLLDQNADPDIERCRTEREYDLVARSIAATVRAASTIRNAAGSGHGHAASQPVQLAHDAEFLVDGSLSAARWLWKRCMSLHGPVVVAAASGRGGTWRTRGRNRRV